MFALINNIILKNAAAKKEPKVVKILSVKLDPIKELKPSVKHLNIPEAERIVTILSELIRKIEILDIIELFTNNDEKVRNIINNELNSDYEYESDSLHSKEVLADLFISMCQNYRTLSNSYRKMQRLKDPRHQAKKKDMVMLIQAATKDILRVLIRRPKFFAALKSEFKTKRFFDNKINELLLLLDQLKDLMYDRLIESPKEQKEIFEYIKELSMNEKQNSIVIAKLRKEIKNYVELTDIEINKRNDQIRQLEADFKEVERSSNEIISQKRLNTDIIESNELRESNIRKEKLLEDLKEHKRLYKEMVAEHGQHELHWRMEVWKWDQGNEALIRKYDSMFATKQKKYDEIEALYNEELKQLNELEERFKPLETEYIQIMEEQRIKQLKLKEEQENFERITRYAIIIQSLWRGYKLRKGLYRKLKKPKNKHNNGKKK